MQNKKGFTLIELMIVVAIIAILAMIAVPMYQRYIERSRNSAAQATLQQASTALVAYSVDNSNYPTTWALTDVEDLMSYGFRPDSNVAMSYEAVNAGFVLFAVHKATGSQVYVYDNINASGVQPMASATATEGGVVTAADCGGTLPLFSINGSGEASSGDGAGHTTVTVTASGGKLLASALN